MDDLLKAAFVGTRGHAPPGADAHPVDALVPEHSGDAERTVLLRAGARAVWRTAGYRPRRDVPIPEACPPDASPILSDRAAQLLRHGFASHVRGLLADLLQQMHAAGLRLPPALLPEALSLGRTHDIRQPLRGVIGERGRWLARLNPDWSWAAADQVDIADPVFLRRRWEEGTPGERVEALKSLRALDAAEARNWLETSFTSEKAEARSRFLEALTTHLSHDDEPFLERCLSDRSEAVRTAAADLLARLPQSAFVARMSARADEMLSASKRGLLKRSLKLSCTPPQQLEKDWQRDAVPKEAAHLGIGARAAWTESVLSRVPLSHWTMRFEASPAELLSAAQADEYAEAIIAGWTRAVALSQGTSECGLPLADYWFEALNAASASQGKRAEPFQQLRARELLQTLISSLSAADAEALLQRRLGSGNEIGNLAIELLDRLSRPWSREFTSEWLKRAMTELRAKSRYHWEPSLVVAVSAAPLSTLETILQALEPVLADPEQKFHATTQAAFDGFRLRHEFHRAVQEQMTSSTAR